MLLDFLDPDAIEAGCDEAGRGCLAGPVFAAAVIIPKGVIIEGLNDSKQLTEKIRKQLRIEIESKCHWKVASLSPAEIDKINILNASIRSMQLALDGLEEPFNHILIDGNRFKPYKDIRYTTVVKGDGKYKSIAAASILAKVERDRYIENLCKENPELIEKYGIDQNKGYGAKRHLDGIKEHGITVWHRRSFGICKTFSTF
jgi:ribonuclease HII